MLFLLGNMTEFESYFSDDAIIRLLCKYRMKIAHERHKLHLLADVSSSQKILRNFKEKAQVPEELSDLLPARRKWYRPNEKERKKFLDPQKLNEFALFKTIQIQRKRNVNGSVNPEWSTRLEEFIQSLRERAKDPTLSDLQKPQIIPILKDRTSPKCRPISAYKRIDDRIILSLTAKYFTQKFDDAFLECSYAFRAVKTVEAEKIVRTHHDTIQRIIQYRNERKTQKIFVAECDLQKFFDCINHETIVKCLEVLSDTTGIRIDNSARIIFQQYLDSYSFNESVFPLNSTAFFARINTPNAFFPWVQDQLIERFYPDEGFQRLQNNRIGIPQGGALSTFISNLVLHFVDQEVYRGADKDLLYLRFCDDMILFHVDRNKCQEALDRYLNQIKKLRLLIHEPKEVEIYSKEYWKDSKSKMPYVWGSPKEHRASIPYVAFVGYQIRFDGLIRIRKSSIIKELKKQREECNTIIESLRFGNSHMNVLSKKSKKQQVFAVLNRLISMSVGRIRLFNLSGKQSLCWANGFKALTLNTTTLYQLKMLDRARRANLKRVIKKLSPLTRPSTNVEVEIDSKVKYFGAPFSYFGIQHRR